MKRVAVAVLAAAALAGTAAAQIGSGTPKCESDYKEFWGRMASGVAKELTGAQLAQLNRYALRGYDGCTSGDERFAARDVFKRLEAIDPKTADRFLRDLETSIPAKR